MLVSCMLWHLLFLRAIGKAKKCLVGCQVTNHNSTKWVFSVLTAWVLWFVKNRVDMLVLEHYILATELWVHVSRLPVPHLDSDQWKHFILNILLLVGSDATHSFTSILLLHALHTLDRNCTCQNNPSLGFFLWHVWYLHVFSSISVHMVVWEAFLFLLTHHHLAHVCSFHLPSYSSSFITNFFHCAGGGVGNSSSSSSYTPPSAHVIPYHSSLFITTFIPVSHVPSSTQSYKHLSFSGGWALLNTNCYWFTETFDFKSAQSPRPVFCWGWAYWTLTITG